MAGGESWTWHERKKHHHTVLVGFYDFDQPSELRWQLLLRQWQGREPAKNDAGRFI
jgi:hypothetical protein